MIGWTSEDYAWKSALIESLRNGRGMISGPDVYDVYPAHYRETYEESWHQAEMRSANAIRTTAVYLDDKSIAARRAQRKVNREKFDDAQAELKKRREEERLAGEEAQRLWEERARQRAEQDAEWNGWHEERARILKSVWQCPCKRMNSPKSEFDGNYRLACDCGRTARGPHAWFVSALEARVDPR